jgi:hypothetical protein
MALFRIGTQKVIATEVRLKSKMPCCKCGKIKISGLRLRWLQPKDKIAAICNECIATFIEKAPESSLSPKEEANPYEPTFPVDIKVYELAKQLDCKSKEVLVACDDLDYIKSHMSTVLAGDVLDVTERAISAVG